MRNRLQFQCSITFLRTFVISHESSGANCGTIISRQLSWSQFSYGPDYLMRRVLGAQVGSRLSWSWVAVVRPLQKIVLQKTAVSSLMAFPWQGFLSFPSHTFLQGGCSNTERTSSGCTLQGILLSYSTALNCMSCKCHSIRWKYNSVDDSFTSSF